MDELESRLEEIKEDLIELHDEVEKQCVKDYLYSIKLKVCNVISIVEDMNKEDIELEQDCKMDSADFKEVKEVEE